jgi:hypothetical protein
LRQRLVLTLSGVVINADTPSETVIALPPVRTVPQRVRCLPLSPVRSESASHTKSEPGRPIGSRALDDAATAFDEITCFR